MSGAGRTPVCKPTFMNVMGIRKHLITEMAKSTETDFMQHTQHVQGNGREKKHEKSVKVHMFVLAHDTDMFMFRRNSSRRSHSKLPTTRHMMRTMVQRGSSQITSAGPVYGNSGAWSMTPNFMSRPNPSCNPNPNHNCDSNPNPNPDTNPNPADNHNLSPDTNPNANRDSDANPNLNRNQGY